VVDKEQIRLVIREGVPKNTRPESSEVGLIEPQARGFPVSMSNLLDRRQLQVIHTSAQSEKWGHW